MYPDKRIVRKRQKQKKSMFIYIFIEHKKFHIFEQHHPMYATAVTGIPSMKIIIDNNDNDK